MSAIHNGNLDCIKYMIDNGLVNVANKPYCDIAAKKGNFECLQYLHENGCKFNKYTGLIAMIREDNKCLKYILQNGGKINMPTE
jgi:ankyrin repeat protein